MITLTTAEREALADACENIPPGRHAMRVAIAIETAVETILAGRLAVACDHRLALLRAVASYDAANQSDLPLGLLDSIRAEVAR